MRRLLVLSAIVLTGMLAVAPAAAGKSRAVVCDDVITGSTLRANVIVPAGGSCRLVDSTVRGDVRVRSNGYFQATNTTVRGDVSGKRAETIFLEGGSAVRGDVEADRTAQVFVFASKVGGEIDVVRATDKVNVCGNTVRGSIAVEKSGPDILVGDPLALDCPGNIVKRGDIELQDNATDVELVVRGNTIKRGNLEVRRNGGPSGKFVEGNKGGAKLDCRGNSQPFKASGNTGWRKKSGQCGAP
jgi:hypothetical protein